MTKYIATKQLSTSKGSIMPGEDVPSGLSAKEIAALKTHKAISPKLEESQEMSAEAKAAEAKLMEKAKADVANAQQAFKDAKTDEAKKAAKTTLDAAIATLKELQGK